MFLHIIANGMIRIKLFRSTENSFESQLVTLNYDGTYIWICHVACILSDKMCTKCVRVWWTLDVYKHRVDNDDQWHVCVCVSHIAKTLCCFGNRNANEEWKMPLNLTKSVRRSSNIIESHQIRLISTHSLSNFIFHVWRVALNSEMGTQMDTGTELIVIFHFNGNSFNFDASKHTQHTTHTPGKCQWIIGCTICLCTL